MHTKLNEKKKQNYIKSKGITYLESLKLYVKTTKRLSKAFIFSRDKNYLCKQKIPN